MLDKDDSPGSCHLDSSESIPPWERKDIRQLPYMDGSSPALSSVERDALPELWATRTNTTRGTRPRVNTSDPGVRYIVQHSNKFEGNFDSGRVKTPLTAPPPQTHNSPVHIPVGPKSAGPHVATKRSKPAQAPVTPPDSVSRTSTADTWKSTSDTSKSNSPHSQKAVVALPGTMPSAHDRGRNTSRSRNGASRRQARQKQTRMNRWKLVIKEIFTYHPVDESQFERIEHSHWTDEVSSPY